METVKIEVRRTDYPERTIRYRNGRTRKEAARYECRYLYEGKEIALYYSDYDTLYLKTDLIGHDFKKPEYERALSCKYKDAYATLFEMLGVDKTSLLSEYTGM